MATKSILEKTYRFGFVLGTKDPIQLGTDSIFGEDIIYDSLDEISYYSDRNKMIDSRLKKWDLMDKYISSIGPRSMIRFYSAPVIYDNESDLGSMSLIKNKDNDALDLLSNKVVKYL